MYQRSWCINLTHVGGSEEKQPPHHVLCDGAIPHHQIDPVTASVSTVKDVFLSYGREPTMCSFVERLRSKLEQAGYSVWLDTEDITSGSEWQSAIGEALRDCKAMVSSISTKYLQSRYCKKELYLAESLNKPIFPILMDDIELDPHKDSGVLFIIASLNWTKARRGGDLDDVCSRLLEGFKKYRVEPSRTTAKPLRKMKTSFKN